MFANPWDVHDGQDVCEPLDVRDGQDVSDGLGCYRALALYWGWLYAVPYVHGSGCGYGSGQCEGLGLGIGRGWAREEAGEGCAARGERRCGERERGRCVGRGELHRPILFIREHLTILFIEWFKLKTYFIKLFTTHIQLFCTI